MTEKIIIIGAVAAGTKAAAKAFRENPNLEIKIFTDEKNISYAGCGLPYYLSGIVQKKEKLIARTPEYFKKMMNIDIFTEHYVSKINPQDKSVTVINLQTKEESKHPFDKLVIATGSRAIRPPIPGIDLKNIFHLKTVEDALAIRNLIDEGKVKNVVIIGGGYIGLEAAENFKEKNLNVTIVELKDQLIPNFDKDVALNIEKYIKEKGVEIYTNDQAKEFIGNENGEVTKVKTQNREIPADLVLAAVGVYPNTQIAKDAGIEIGQTKAIRTNEKLQTNYPFIYAAGDCAESINLITEKPIWVPLGSTANKMGRVVGINIADGNDKFPGILGTAIFKVFEMNIGITGLTEKQAKDEGYDTESAIVPVGDKAHYYPGGKAINIKLIADKKTERVLGAQIWGEGAVDKALDTIATAITFKATANDLLSLDLCYAPPFSPALGPPIVAGNVLQNKLQKKTEGILPLEVKEKFDNGKKFTFLDVRNPMEFIEGKIEPCTNIPIQNLVNNANELDPNSETIISCRIGNRAATAYRILKNKGFKKVKYMDGGIITWPLEMKKVIG